MKIKDLYFLAEVTKKDTANVDGGGIQDISSGLFNIIPGVIPSFTPVVDDLGFIGFERITPEIPIPFDLGIP